MTDPDVIPFQGSQGHGDAARLKDALHEYEELAARGAEISLFQRELLDELKNEGFDIKAFRKIVALRKKSEAALVSEAAMLELYLEALGLEIKGVIA